MKTEEQKKAMDDATWLTASVLAAALQEELLQVQAQAGVPIADDVLARALALVGLSARLKRPAFDAALDAAAVKLAPALEAVAKLEEQINSDPVLQEKLSRAGTSACTCGSPKCPGNRANLH